MHTYSLNGIRLIWQCLCDSPNHQTKTTIKYTMYTVCSVIDLYCVKFMILVFINANPINKCRNDELESNVDVAFP